MVDEMFDGPGEMEVVNEDVVSVGGVGAGNNAAGGAQGANNQVQQLLSVLASSERTVHADFPNDFKIDLFDLKDLE